MFYKASLDPLWRNKVFNLLLKAPCHGSQLSFDWLGLNIKWVGLLCYVPEMTVVRTSGLYVPFKCFNASFHLMILPLIHFIIATGFRINTHVK